MNIYDCYECGDSLALDYCKNCSKPFCWNCYESMSMKGVCNECSGMGKIKKFFRTEDKYNVALDILGMTDTELIEIINCSKNDTTKLPPSRCEIIIDNAELNKRVENLEKKVIMLEYRLNMAEGKIMSAPEATPQRSEKRTKVITSTDSSLADSFADVVNISPKRKNRKSKKTQDK